MIGLGLNEAAYMAEIVRAGISSVGEGQTEASVALGMSWSQTMRRTVLPQAMRVIIPPTGNELISMLKTTSLVTAIPLSTELYGRARDISGTNFQPIPLLLVAATWYLAITSVLMVGQFYLERYYSKGVVASADLQATAGTGRRAGQASRDRPSDRTRGRDRPRHPGRRTKMTGATATPMVKADRVCKNFGALQVLKGITLEVGRGQVLCLVGPSGSGKSTFLRCINHLEQVNAGRLYVDGDLVGYREKHGKLYEMKPPCAAKQRRDIGMVFQHFNLFPHRTALENVIEAPTQVKRVPKKQAVERARELLDRVGLGEKARRLPGAAVGRAAAARRHRPRAGDGPEADAVRRADVGARSRSWSERCSASCASSPRPA